jgi:hypothetical protein
LIVLCGAGVAFALLLAAFVSIRRRRTQLEERFGPEYERAVASEGRGPAERHLDRVKREHEERMSMITKAHRELRRRREAR